MAQAEILSRAQERSSVKADCHYRIGSGIAYPARLVDLTAEGARLEGISRSLNVGDMLTVRFGGLAPVEAKIQWVERGREVGLRFLQPLYPSVYLHVLANLQKGKTPDLQFVKAIPLRSC
ncbi:PilZ domain-containing protein [Croceicoccus marinus]|uniref:PilZ domain-containing protein n=1 Tax=Croceicoccus marinus TaxID=450378 RepID=A0A1Z1FA56_9SPHN|nr:PilZ domain-containing protein [Croceicoccus marinus]ARU15634.1 PilZ domain-containing protein [Croceicoccus marinus]